MGDCWQGEGWLEKGSPHLLCNKQVIHGLKPEMRGGESWAPSRQAAPPSLLFRTAMLFVMVPLERAVSRIFNAKWAKIQRFLPIQWIDFLLWVCAGTHHQCLSPSNGCVQDCPYFTALTNVHAGNCKFVYVGYVSSRNCVCAHQCASLKNTDLWSAFWQEAFTSCRFTCPTRFQ